MFCTVMLCTANRSHREELDFMLFVLEVRFACEFYYMFDRYSQ